jgi:molybdate transport system substrate-binding protein
MRQARMTGVLAGLLFAVAAGNAVPVGAAEIRVLSAGAVKAAVVDLAKDFERDTGHTVRFTFATVGVLQKKIAEGETADLFIMTDVALEEQMRNGTVAVGSRTDIARVGVGVAVRAGSRLPDISTTEAFRQTVLAATSIVYMDPTKGGTSGIHFAAVLQRLGIADQVRGKTTLWPEGYAAEAVAKGDVELCIHQISEILAVKGVTLAGPLPRELQKVSIYSAGVAARANAPEAATMFLAFLQTPSSRATFKQVGLDYTE